MDAANAALRTVLERHGEFSKDIIDQVIQRARSQCPHLLINYDGTVTAYASRWLYNTALRLKKQGL